VHHPVFDSISRPVARWEVLEVRALSAVMDFFFGMRNVFDVAVAEDVVEEDFLCLRLRNFLSVFF